MGAIYICLSSYNKIVGPNVWLVSGILDTLPLKDYLKTEENRPS